MGFKYMVLLVALASTSAEAVDLIKITAEAEPGKFSVLGVDTDVKNEITGLYYRDSNGKKLSFTVAQLSMSQVMLRQKGHDLVFIRATSSQPTMLALKLSFKKNALTGGSMGSRYFTVKYNASLSTYELYDEKQRHITRAYATTHRNYIGMAVGIDEIQTQ